VFVQFLQLLTKEGLLVWLRNQIQGDVGQLATEVRSRKVGIINILRHNRSWDTCFTFLSCSLILSREVFELFVISAEFQRLLRRLDKFVAGEALRVAVLRNVGKKHDVARTYHPTFE